ncbi:type I-MYXAN CRISPR-associated protein Cas5/Cmx5/DevS [Chroogloeocystis siderophila]|uniref:Type I-MYXAN CRISPR-associated protein Cas5/Cmx5/DevS n=1 Tax=Chroogloeocystis siderophila 5.2 s.c.1 TaxID=247279 RepID=A0A1U7HMB7_9CHRO|nr:type I-MYXAN CRISPR-associated protein Cas5/Cmx5/DevS [Chroogloeocystis siderophila]OKH24704.1 type I-MYXAN CRISPR-associated protein Cas5/Cmx5/DevS [Chroogloeocystis siderophila 5.2 s.c.1]
MSDILYLECPCSSFPRSFARDYKETYLYPPPSTIYGFLLSLVGEEDLTAHLGVKLAIGIVGVPLISRILRKQRHHKFSKTHMGTYPPSQFSKPNFQELLTDIKVVIKIDSTKESASVKLDERVAIALATPEQITRFGGLSLGESWALINGIRNYRPEDGEIQWLVKDNRGLIGLPIWIDRQTTQGTFQRFSLSVNQFDENCWTEIQVPIKTKATKFQS